MKSFTDLFIKRPVLAMVIGRSVEGSPLQARERTPRRRRGQYGEPCDPRGIALDEARLRALDPGVTWWSYHVPALLEAEVVVRADAGQHGDLFAAQPAHAPHALPRGRCQLEVAGEARVVQKRSMYWSISHRCTCSL